MFTFLIVPAVVMLGGVTIRFILFIFILFLANRIEVAMILNPIVLSFSISLKPSEALPPSFSAVSLGDAANLLI